MGTRPAAPVDNGTLTPAAQETLVTFALSLVLATAAGSVLGVLVGAFRRVDRALGPSLEFARSMPPAAMVPIAALLIGYGETMKVAVVTFAAVWPVLLNARAGVRNLDPSSSTPPAHSTSAGSTPSASAWRGSSLLGVRVAAPVALVITLLSSRS